MATPSGSTSAPPARAKHKLRDLVWVLTANFGEGLPWSVIHQMGTDYLVAVHSPIKQRGYTSLLHLATTLKFLWSPIIDLGGKRRTWMLALQVVMGAGMLGVAVATRQGLVTLPAFWVALAVLAVIHATHDIACDGYYLLALNRGDQALYAGPRVAAYRTAMLVGSSALIALAGTKSWPVGFSAAAILMTGVGLLNLLVVPHVDEPTRTRDPSASFGEKRRAFFAAYRTFFDQPHIVSVLLFILTLKLGDIWLTSMSRTMMEDIGINARLRGVLGTPSLISQIVGTIVAGAMLARWGLQRMLVPIIFFMNLAIPMYAVLAWTAPPFHVVVPVVCIEQLAIGMGATAQSVYLMQRCRPAFSASHYAFATAITAVGTLSGVGSGYLYAAVGKGWYFICCFALGLPSMILAIIVPKTPIENESR